jgi:ABC-type phosphate transport system substrate-binding protein
VRLDESGTTHIFKKYLGLISLTKFETEKAEEKTWPEVAEGHENTTWPKAAAVVRPEKTGGGAVVSKVAETSSSIGYASLADARANGSFSKTGGPGTAKFWSPIQNNGVSTKAPTYADPSTNGDVEAVANANCAKEKYTNGKGTKFPPATTAATWNEVTTETKEKNYTICGLSYLMGLSSYSAYPGTAEGEATSAENYLNWVLETKTGGGQPAIVGRDLEPIPTSLVKEAQKGAKLLKF